MQRPADPVVLLFFILVALIFVYPVTTFAVPRIVLIRDHCH